MRSLKEFMEKRGVGYPQSPLRVDDKTIFHLFRKIVREEYGARGATELTPATFSEGVLSVKANNPLYSSELWMRREAVIERINTALEGEGVKEIRLVRYNP
jgi:hypothetical protein